MTTSTSSTTTTKSGFINWGRESCDHNYPPTSFLSYFVSSCFWSLFLCSPRSFVRSVDWAQLGSERRRRRRPNPDDWHGVDKIDRTFAVRFVSFALWQTTQREDRADRQPTDCAFFYIVFVVVSFSYRLDTLKQLGSARFSPPSRRNSISFHALNSETNETKR